jgi:AcrR family transcriptional regulator
MFSPNQLPWIQHGYVVFAQKGPAHLRVEEMAREVGISKSSFYHHFADAEIFMTFLLRYHEERARELANEAAQCAHAISARNEMLFHSN